MLGPRAVLSPAICPGEPGAVCVHHSEQLVLFSFKNCHKVQNCTAYPIEKKKINKKKNSRPPLRGVNAAGSAAAPGRALFAVGSGAGTDAPRSALPLLHY